MKRIMKMRIVAMFVMAAVMFGGFAVNVSALETNSVDLVTEPIVQSNENVYVYPDINISDSYADKLRTVQIPDEIMESMTTRELLLSCIDYPFLVSGAIMATSQEQFEKLSSEFNGIRELVRRPDAAKELIAFYSALDMEQFNEHANHPILTIEFIEMLLARPEITSSMDNGDISDLMDATLRMAVYKSESADYSILPTSELCANVLCVAESDYIDSVMNDERVSLVGITEETISEMLTETTADLSLSENTTDSSRIVATSYVTLYTPNGTQVVAISMANEPEITQAKKNEYYAEFNGRFNARPASGSDMRDTMTNRYNCHSYAWYYQSTRNTVWINSPAQSAYWTDGSYIKCGSSINFTVPSGVSNGCKVVYRTTDHSAIVYNKSSNELISKWGDGPLMIHRADQCPYDATTIDFYKANY